MVNPELRRRFVDSIEYLRKMDFFSDYSNLTSKEIFDKILSGEIDYETQWFVEEWSEERRRKFDTYGQILKKLLEDHERRWMKASDFEVDLEVAPFDVKRVFVEDTKTIIRKGICKILLKKLARISRGSFNPRYIGEEMSEWEEPHVPPLLGKTYFGAGWIFKVSFEFKGEKHLVEFYSDGKYLYLNPAVEAINGLIKDTGYQYYDVPYEEYECFIVFTPDEVEKLKRERGWKPYLPRVMAHN